MKSNSNYLYGRSIESYFQQKDMYKLTLDRRLPRVRIFQGFFENNDNARDAVAARVQMTTKASCIGSPQTREDKRVGPDGCLQAWTQVVFEVDYRKGAHVRDEIKTEIFENTQPELLWKDDDKNRKAGYTVLFQVGSIADQIGPTVRYGRSFNGLSEGALRQMQKELREKSLAEHAASVARGDVDVIPEEDPDLVSETASQATSHCSESDL